jgi:thioredoxin-like negative regulator of GroEL
MRSSFAVVCTLIVSHLIVVSGCGNVQPPLQLASPARSESRQPKGLERHVDFVTSYPEALAEASQSGKPILVFFSTAECIFCHQMLEGAFRDQQVVRLAGEFICVRVEAGENPEVCKDFHIEAFPTVQFIASDGVPLHRILGRKEPETLASQMQAALQGPHARTAYRTPPAVR